MIRQLGVAIAITVLATACSDGWIADGDAAVWVSDDGENWTRIVDEALGGDGDQQMTAIAQGPGGLVAVGLDSSTSDASAWRSGDGIAWERVGRADFSMEGFQMAWDVTWTSLGWVAAGAADGTNDLDGMVWQSRDGENWSVLGEAAAAVGGPGLQRLFAVHEHDGTIYLGGIDEVRPTVWSSNDGVTWTQHSLPFLEDDADVGGMATVEGQLAVAGRDGSSAVMWFLSDEGWERFEGDGLGTNEMMWALASGQRAVGVGGDIVVEAIFLLGRGGREVSDAAVWTLDGSGIRGVRDPEFGGPAYQEMRGLTAFTGGHVAVGRRTAATGDHADVDAAVWMSTDGTSWRQIVDSTLAGPGWQDMLDIIDFGGLLVAVGGNDEPTSGS